ncbi:MAG TPA: hypothetical protein VFD58_31170 [Blastocatellia bacterium]|nr:hypothetical protein [Blastocatellia bacterium]
MDLKNMTRAALLTTLFKANTFAQDAAVTATGKSESDPPIPWAGIALGLSVAACAIVVAIVVVRRLNTRSGTARLQGRDK